MRKIILAAGVLALAGCAYPNPQHVAALNALVGKPETDVIHALGVPSRTYDAAGHRYLAYSMSRIETIPGDNFGYGGFGYGYGFGGFYGGGGFGGFAPEIIQRDCETTFDLSAGIVQNWSLRGNAC